MKKIIFTFLSVLLVLSLLIGCATKTSETSDSDTDEKTTEKEDVEVENDSTQEYFYRVGFVNIDDQDQNCYPATQEFVKAVESKEFEEKVGAKVEAITADSAKDLEKQTTNVETMITRGVDALFIIGVNTEGNTVAVEAANDAGIPVFMVGTEASGGEWKFIGFDETELGLKQGEWMANNLSENEKICYLQGVPGREAAILREEGFREGLSAREDLEIISSQTGEFETAVAMQVTEDWIQAYGDQIGAIVSADSMMAIGAVEALKAAQMTDKVVTAGVMTLGKQDGYMIEDGDMSYAVFVSWPSIGTLCADVAAKVYTDEKIDDRTTIELHDVTIDNYEEIVEKYGYNPN